MPNTTFSINNETSKSFQSIIMELSHWWIKSTLTATSGDDNVSVERTPLELIKTFEFWVLFFVLAVIIGLGLSFQGNIGKDAQAFIASTMR